MKNICIIGAGNIGSRHLQGLKKTGFPLSITVIDPSLESLKTAQQRYTEINSPINHSIVFSEDMKNLPNKIDLAIIATSSNIRRQVTEQLLKNSNVKYLILEKILFQNREDYLAIGNLLKRKNCKTWINFNMRIVPFYFNLQKEFAGNPIQFIVTGSKFGLVTNSIHFVDYIAFLTGCYEFTIETNGLDTKPIDSKRKGFLELNGTLNVHYKDGSFGSFTCYPDGDAPYLFEVYSKKFRFISRENEKKAWISSSKNNWTWEEINSKILYQSEMTNLVVEKILKSGTCNLATYQEASKVHLHLLEGLIKFLNQSKKKYSFYPFT